LALSAKPKQEHWFEVKVVPQRKPQMPVAAAFAWGQLSVFQQVPLGERLSAAGQAPSALPNPV
jgi:hypothetical protein